MNSCKCSDMFPTYSISQTNALALEAAVALGLVQVVVQAVAH